MEETGDPQRREARGDGTRRSLGDGHAPGVEGNPSRLEQVRQLWKVFLQEDEIDRKPAVPKHPEKKFRQLSESRIELVINTQQTKQMNKHGN